MLIEKADSTVVIDSSPDKLVTKCSLFGRDVVVKCFLCSF